MKTYFGYIRVSTPRQGKGVSLDEQRSAILAFAAKHGLEIAEWFVETETAARQGRTEYTKMIRALENGKAAGVVIHKIDRGARNAMDWANLGELLDAGVDIQFAHENLDLRSRGGRLAADIQAVVAADYIRNLRDEVLKGFYGRLKQGVYPLPAPVGYLDCGAGIPKAIDPIAGPLLRYAFERYAKGDIGLFDLQQDLAGRGLRTRRGGPLSLNGLAWALHNPFYTGIMRIKRRGESFQGAHTPLVTQALFDSVQDVLTGRHAPKGKRHAFRYKAMIAHAGCTRRLTGEIIKGRFVYYRCHGRQCRGASITERSLDEATQELLHSAVSSPQDIRELRDLVDEARSKPSSDPLKEKQIVQLHIAKCNDRLDRLTDVLLDGAISKEAYDIRNTSLLAERRSLQDQHDSIGTEPNWVERYRMFELHNTQLLRYEKLTDDEIRALLSSLCSNFELQGKNVAITLRYPYSEIVKSRTLQYGGPRWGDVRTRAETILAILMMEGLPADTSPMSLKSLKSTLRQLEGEHGRP